MSIAQSAKDQSSSGALLSKSLVAAAVFFLAAAVALIVVGSVVFIETEVDVTTFVASNVSVAPESSSPYDLEAMATFKAAVAAYDPAAAEAILKRIAIEGCFDYATYAVESAPLLVAPTAELSYIMYTHSEAYAFAHNATQHAFGTVYEGMRIRVVPGIMSPAFCPIPYWLTLTYPDGYNLSLPDAAWGNVKVVTGALMCDLDFCSPHHMSFRTRPAFDDYDPVTHRTCLGAITGVPGEGCPRGLCGKCTYMSYLPGEACYVLDAKPPHRLLAMNCYYPFNDTNTRGTVKFVSVGLDYERTDVFIRLSNDPYLVLENVTEGTGSFLRRVGPTEAPTTTQSEGGEEVPQFLVTYGTSEREYRPNERLGIALIVVGGCCFVAAVAAAIAFTCVVIAERSSPSSATVAGGALDQSNTCSNASDEERRDDDRGMMPMGSVGDSTSHNSTSDAGKGRHDAEAEADADAGAEAEAETSVSFSPCHQPSPVVNANPLLGYRPAVEDAPSFSPRDTSVHVHYDAMTIL